MKRIVALLIALSISVALVGCQAQDYEPQPTQQKIVEDEKPEEVFYEPMYTGETVTSEDWRITLTDAYTSKKLESDESSTAWDANDGYAFLVLEFDITCLNSTKPTITGEGLTELVANAGGNTYRSWDFRYINSQIWCYIRSNSVLDANLPLHIYVYAMIPSATMNSDVSVNLRIAGNPKEIQVN